MKRPKKTEICDNYFCLRNTIKCLMVADDAIYGVLFSCWITNQLTLTISN